ncbi:aminotransferase class IV [Pseudactinotalea sp. Z1739]|uniref:aminotransferase class IV n=1 Tax=Pseudactinotalea sp. Z1739 TaxID=3413028 RepID=UPI003C7E148F
MIVWFDGSIRPSSAGLVDALDHGLTVGDGVFETCELRQGQVFALTRHLHRLHRSATGLGLKAPREQQVREAVEAVAQEWRRTRGEEELGRLRITWTDGPGPLGSERLETPGTLVVAAAPGKAPGPVRVRVVPWTRNERSAVAGLKTTSYAENARALAYAAEQGDGEAIFANTRGELCEGTGTNIFLESDGVLITPPLESGCLAGITRALVLEWAGDYGIEVREETLPLSALHEAQHAALTSSTRGLVPVVAVDGRELHPGPATSMLGREFTARSVQQIDP